MGALCNMRFTLYVLAYISPDGFVSFCRCVPRFTWWLMSFRILYTRHTFVQYVRALPTHRFRKIFDTYLLNCAAIIRNGCYTYYNTQT
ncbi:hypothetical protein HMPREF3190_00077 [Umbribacter vaginalis]|nr:hypothetical protein HMPREF3190_00077 [Coriobacteriales bacterium DNF00809]